MITAVVTSSETLTHIGDGNLTLSLSAALLHLHLSLFVTSFDCRSSPPIQQISQFFSAFLKSMASQVLSSFALLSYPYVIWVFFYLFQFHIWVGIFGA
ncbi:hypothetical protein PRUPE_8G099200 [Prunus persica]|uniref:Uncharacterized protein n=1 Tax=Prunus persica TaxID=3760 RepID=M5W758_PRUPE|nr:hypothetical protein PRUPE_8G099200 [Prunus persica]